MVETELGQTFIDAIEAAEKLVKSLKAVRDIIVGDEGKPEKPNEEESKSST